MYHYVYRITNLKIGKHYYGVRSSKNKPINDIGVKYFSSSTDSEFRTDQLENPKNYRYKTVNVFDNRKEAETFETKLHEKFQVHTNENFYNKAINTNMGFSVAGVPKSSEHRYKIGSGTRDKTYEDIYGVEGAEIQKDKLRKPKTTSHRKALSKSRTGMKLSKENCEAISQGLKKRYSDKKYLKTFSEKMNKVNKDPDKRKTAGQKIKEKWKDPEYRNKIVNGKRGSNSKSLKEKWADPEWREYMLECRRKKKLENKKD